MKHKTVLVLSGIATAFAMVVMLGLFQLSAMQPKTAQAASVAPVSNTAAVSQVEQLNADVATLQAEVAAYQQKLQESYTALQQAYNEIQVLSAGNNTGGLQRRGDNEQFDFFQGGRDD